MMLIAIALRNLSRNRRRTQSALLAISVGTACLLLTGGFVRYSFEGLRGAIIGGGLGDFEVAPVDSGTTPSAMPAGQSPSFPAWREVREAIERSETVAAASATIQFTGMATNGDRSSAFVGAATEPDRDRRGQVQVRLRSGDLLPDADPPEGENKILLGTGLARQLAAGPGDVITIMTATTDGALNALDVTVAGTFSTGFQDLDDRIVRTHTTTARRLLEVDDVSSLIVHLKDRDNARGAQQDIEARAQHASVALSVVGWEARAPFYGQVRAMYTGIFLFLGAVVAALVTLSNSNTLIMSMLERVREFGTLLAIGTTRLELAALQVCEAIGLGVIGTMAGGVLAFAAAGIINLAGVKMPPPPGAVDPIDLAVIVLPQDLVWAFAFVLVIVLLAAIAPIRRVFRLNVIDALGHV